VYEWGWPGRGQESFFSPHFQEFESSLVWDFELFWDFDLFSMSLASYVKFMSFVKSTNFVTSRKHTGSAAAARGLDAKSVICSEKIVLYIVCFAYSLLVLLL